MVNYYIYESKKNDKDKKNAGSKARDDVYKILNNLGYKDISVPPINCGSTIWSKIKGHINIMNTWNKRMDKLKRGDFVVIQYPIDAFLFSAMGNIKRIQKRGIHVCLLLHDLEILRESKNKQLSTMRRLGLYLSEKRGLQQAEYIIVHNDYMKDYMSHRFKNLDGRMFPLEIFDYLLEDCDLSKTSDSKTNSVIIAGNLNLKKCGYLRKLPTDVEFRLYGVGYEKTENENIKYEGSYLPDELPKYLNGAFGLVWDGESENTCSGAYGEYLRYNNPHKLSLYLASGIPVIVWKEAAVAKFVLENRCGLVVDTLSDIRVALDEISSSEYLELQKNSQIIGKRLSKGYYTQKAIGSVLERMNGTGED